MDFYKAVHDQTYNLTPLGNGDSPPIIHPRMEGWAAVCDLYDIPKAKRAELIDGARFLFDAVHGRVIVHGLFTIPVEEFAELEPLPPETDIVNG